MVLAAGAGTRYGGPKVFAEGGAWLRGACAALAGAGCSPVHVVLGAGFTADTAVSPPGTVAVYAPDWAAGPGASLRAGLASLPGAEAVAVLLVDTPDITAEVVRRVAAGAGPSMLARAVYGGAPGHPVVVGRQHWEALAAGPGGGRSFLEGHPALRRVECSDLATGVDRDSP